ESSDWESTLRRNSINEHQELTHQNSRTVFFNQAWSVISANWRLRLFVAVIDGCCGIIQTATNKRSRQFAEITLHAWLKNTVREFWCVSSWCSFIELRRRVDSQSELSRTPQGAQPHHAKPRATSLAPSPFRVPTDQRKMLRSLGVRVGGSSSV